MEGYSYSHSHSHSHSHSRSHSRPQPSFQPPKTFSTNKRPPPHFNYNNGGFSTSYDDVFGGPPRFAASSSLAPRSEDYSEIFGAFRSSSSSRASSIPVLDLPAVSDIDSGSSFDDYSEVFGGLNAVDFAAPYDELFGPSDAGDVSSDEAWTPVGTESLSDDSDPLAFSDKSNCFLNGNSHPPLDSKQFNVSYHKLNLESNTYMPNMTHVAQLNAVPGYTCVVDEATSLGEVGTERLCSPLVDDIVLSMDSSSNMSAKHIRKTMSKTSHDGGGFKSFNGDGRSGRARSASMSYVDSTFASISDINLSSKPSHLPPPSRPPPVWAERKGESDKLTPCPKASKDSGLETTTGGNLPPYFDMEVDASSSAAVSAAAMKHAMEKAQAKLKAAKELMDRKDSLQNSVKVGLKDYLHGGEKVKMSPNVSVSAENGVQVKCDGMAKMKSSDKGGHAKRASQILPDISAVEQSTDVTWKPAERLHGKKCNLSKDPAVTGGARECKEATQYYDFANNDSSGLAPQSPSNSNGKIAAQKQQENDEHDSDSAGEACVPDENRRRLKTTKAVSRQEYYEKMVKVAQEVHDRVIDGYAEAKKSLKGMSQEQKTNLGYQPGKNERKRSQAQLAEDEKSREAIRADEAEMRPENALGKEEIKKKEPQASYEEHNNANANSSHESRSKTTVDMTEEERRMLESCEREKSESRVQETVIREENEQRVKEACVRQWNEKEVVEVLKQKRDRDRREEDEGPEEAFEDGFVGERMQTACESQENDKTKHLQQRNVENKKFKEDFVDVVFEGRLQRTRESEENDRTKYLKQRDDYENHVEDAVDRRRSDQMLEECFQLEDCRKCKGAPEQEKSRHRLNEAHMLVADNMGSEEGQKRNEIQEKLEKIMEQEQVQNTSTQAVEIEEIRKNYDDTGDEEDQKLMYRNGIKIEWQDKDQGPDSSSEIELPVEDKHMKSSDEVNLDEKDIELDNLFCKLKNPEEKAGGCLEVPPRKKNGEVGSVPLAESTLEASETMDVLLTERSVESTAAQMAVNEDEKTGQATNALHISDDDTESGAICTRTGQLLKGENVPIADPKLVEDLGQKIGKLGKDQVLGDQEDNVRSIPAEGINGGYEHERKKEGAHTSMPEKNESIQRSQVPSICHSTERKGRIISQTCCSEQNDKEKECDPEKEQLKKLEEEREREREREKDRMAVEIAIREARDRACADARDRAERSALERAADEARQRAMAEARERAADEVRQRAMTEARERLERACAEARERSLADKSSESRLRAERAAVERATAEARQRAIEKAMTERASFEARERIQRSVSEKYSSERYVIMRQSSLPTSREKFETDDGEPAQRCKARLERHQRTVERVAKALAEKNMRDLLSQREQAERNRLAETLDADIKRWSSGKEGNLRALLSTLQYILGPDSGWQPIPLTEVITAAAVKRAYRKATLYVHPDKLQQRGASIQQKYICEKVFDLLKEAWNRFNSEEK